MAPMLTPDGKGYDAARDAPADKSLFQELLGSLNYAAICTRPDLATALSYLGAYAAAPAIKTPARFGLPFQDARLRYLLQEGWICEPHWIHGRCLQRAPWSTLAAGLRGETSGRPYILEIRQVQVRSLIIYRS